MRLRPAALIFLRSFLILGGCTGTSSLSSNSARILFNRAISATTCLRISNLAPSFRCSEGRRIARSLESQSTKWRKAEESTVAPERGGDHTSIMTMKNAALLALVGTVLTTALLFWTLISNVVNVMRDVAAPVVLFSSFIYAFGSLTLAIFFFVFYKAQS